MNRQLVNCFLVVLALQVHSLLLKPFLPLFYLWCCSCENIYHNYYVCAEAYMNEANVHLHGTTKLIAWFPDLTHFTLWLMITINRKRSSTHTHTHPRITCDSLLCLTVPCYLVTSLTPHTSCTYTHHLTYTSHLPLSPTPPHLLSSR